MNDREAYEFYLDPEHLKATGPGRKRKRPTLTSMVPVRFTPEVIERVKAVAHEEGITVSAWIRRAALRAAAVAERQQPGGLIEGSGHAGEPRALTSTLALGPRTFICPHMSIGGVVSASCGTCGPMIGSAA